MKGQVNKTRNSLLLLITATIWGLAFTAQSVGGKEAGPFAFNGIRSILGGIVLIPYIIMRDKKEENLRKPVTKEEKKTLLAGGILCGIMLCIAGNFQQIGLLYTSVGKAGFLTSLYILMVPVIGIFLGRKCPAKIWGCIVVSVFGFYMLCMAGNDDFTIGIGDGLVVLCALFFSFHILVIDYYSPKVDGVRMSCIQFFVCGIITCILMLIFEKPDVDTLLAVKYPMLYAGVLSCGLAYTLQIVGQKGINPAVASLIMSLESVISAIGGYFILGQSLTREEMTGCILVFASVLAAQLPSMRKKEN